jgi:hypothetical protein
VANTLKSVPVVSLSAGFGTIYTVPALTSFTVAVIHLCNTTGAPVGGRVCLVPAAGTPALANALLWDFGVSANGIIELARGQIWLPGDSLQALGSGLNLHLSGIETT